MNNGGKSLLNPIEFPNQPVHIDRFGAASYGGGIGLGAGFAMHYE